MVTRLVETAGTVEDKKTRGLIWQRKFSNSQFEMGIISTSVETDVCYGKQAKSLL
jgi:hypothetical protein